MSALLNKEAFSAALCLKEFTLSALGFRHPVYRTVQYTARSLGCFLGIGCPGAPFLFHLPFLGRCLWQGPWKIRALKSWKSCCFRLEFLPLPDPGKLTAASRQRHSLGSHLGKLSSDRHQQQSLPSCCSLRPGSGRLVPMDSAAL